MTARPIVATRHPGVALLVLLTVASAGAEEFKSSGRYDRTIEIRLVADPAVPLLGQRMLAVEVSASVDRVKFYVDGELAGTDETAPFETRFDFGARPRAHRVMVVAFTAAGTKNKRIFVTDDSGMLDPSMAEAFVVVGESRSEPSTPAGDAGPPPSSPAAARRTAGDLSVIILEPWGTVAVGKQDIVVDARARGGEKVVRVEIFVDAKKVTSLDEPPLPVRVRLRGAAPASGGPGGGLWPSRGRGERHLEQ